MKKFLMRFGTFVCSVAMLFSFATPVHAAYANWTLSYGVKWDGSKFVLENTALSLDGDVAVSLNVAYPDGLTYNEGSVPTGWTGTAGPGSMHYSITAPNNDETSIINFLNQISFDGTYGMDGYVEISVLDRELSCAAFDGDYHCYEFVEKSNPWVTWMAAYNQAKSKTYKGLTGYLATITSQAEQDFIYNSIASKPGWLGGFQMKKVADGSLINDESSISENIADYTSNGNFYWVDGPEAGLVFWNGTDATTTNRIDGIYANWGQPINTQPDGAEQCLEFASGGPGTWNNLSYNYAQNLHNQGYYVEYSPYGGMVEASDNGTKRVDLPKPPVATPGPDIPVVERTCQDDGYPAGYYWDENAQVCVPSAAVKNYVVPNTGVE